MAAWVVRAPIQTLSGVRATALRSSRRLMSTSRSIGATRRLSIGSSDWPPAMAAVVTPLAAERHAGLGHRFRAQIVERRRFHAAAALARRARSTASETRRGVSGVSLKLAPMPRNASATALAIDRRRRDRAAFAETLDAVFGGLRGRHAGGRSAPSGISGAHGTM